ncbi:hypothetical protein Aerorivi_02570 [Aeromonas rivipollensis]|uniref:RloB family protein n=1 Tax=Aeromonas rivipollensis TaxID=948519 RepID=UPI00399C5A9F
MSRYKSPKNRSKQQLERRQANRVSNDKILIVSEGSETEPNYFNAIRKEYRLSSTDIAVLPCAMGTAPIQVVDYAEKLFLEGDYNKRVEAKSFDRVYAVFDRDDHHSYHAALNKARTLNGKLKNNARRAVVFEAIASVPSFEFWLLLHYEMHKNPILRADVIRRLKIKIPDYDKSETDTFNITREVLNDAIEHAKTLAETNNAFTEPEPYTGVHMLVQLLIPSKAQ